MKVKGIMFSGFAAAILMGAVDASAATAFNIASQAYVDQEIGKLSGTNGAITSLNTRMTEAETNISNNTTAISNETSARSTADNAITGRLDVIEGAGAGSIKKAEADAKSYADGLVANEVTRADGKYQTLANKATSLDGPFADDIQYPSAKAVKAAIDGVSSGSSEAVTALENKIGGDFTSTNTVAKAIEAEATARSNADEALSNKIGNIGDNTTVKAQLDLKQNASDSTVASAAEGTYTAITEGTGVGANLVALDGKLKTAEGKIATAEGNITALQGTVNGLTSGNGSVESQINNKLGDLGTGNNTVADALAANRTADQAYTDTKVSELANGAVKANTDAIAELNNTYATDAEVNAKFGGGNGVNALPAYSTCTGVSGKCVLSIDKTTGALEWVEVTAPLTSNN